MRKPLVRVWLLAVPIALIIHLAITPANADGRGWEIPGWHSGGAAPEPAPEPEPTANPALAIIRAGLDPIMVQVARCESGLNPRARSYNVSGSAPGSWDLGLFQINDHWWRSLVRSGDPLDLHDNIRMAIEVLDTQGLDAWRSSRHCWDPTR